MSGFPASLMGAWAHTSALAAAYVSKTSHLQLGRCVPLGVRAEYLVSLVRPMLHARLRSETGLDIVTLIRVVAICAAVGADCRTVSAQGHAGPRV